MRGVAKCGGGEVSDGFERGRECEAACQFGIWFTLVD